MPDRTTGVAQKVANNAEQASEHSVLAPDVDPTASAESAEPGGPVPDIGKTGAALSGRRPASLAILTVLAVLYSLYFARDFLVPIMYAVLLNFLLSPAVRALARWRIPPPVSGALIVLSLLAALGGGAYALSGPASGWIARAPSSLAKAEAKLRGLIAAWPALERELLPCFLADLPAPPPSTDVTGLPVHSLSRSQAG